MEESVNTKKAIVVYKSKSGFTKVYAQRIARELNCDLREASNVSVNQLLTYDTIIYGGGLYGTGINGIELIKKNLQKLKGRKIVIYACGISPENDETISYIIYKNFTEEQQDCFEFFYLRGGFDYKRLSPFYKIVMSLMKWMIKRKTTLTPDESGMLTVFDKPADFTQETSIAELIKYVQ